MACRNKRRINGKCVKTVVLFFIAALILIPVLIPFVYMFMGNDEAARTLGEYSKMEKDMPHLYCSRRIRRCNH